MAEKVKVNPSYEGMKHTGVSSTGTPGEATPFSYDQAKYSGLSFGSQPDPQVPSPAEDFSAASYQELMNGLPGRADLDDSVPQPGTPAPTGVTNS